MKDNSKSAQKPEVTINERQFKSARDGKVTIKWKAILKVREKLKLQWNERQFKSAQDAKVRIE